MNRKFMIFRWPHLTFFRVAGLAGRQSANGMDERPTPPHQGTCRLCLQERPLVNSHIIPNFQFNELKGDDGHFFTLPPDPAKPRRKVQHGFTERLLCAECDNTRLQKYEHYFARFWTKKRSEIIAQATNPLIFRDHDYHATKSFLLSLLWRMSISSLDVFKGVSLGKALEETLRVGLLEDRTFSLHELPVIIVAPLFNGKVLTDFILQPDCEEIDGQQIYRCIVCGLLYSYFVGSLPEYAKPWVLRPAQMSIAYMPVGDIPYLHHAAMKMIQAERLRGRGHPQK